ncbi:Uncharacterized protein Rs2_43763 [Raphanus sativus]|nr:Uncharacterized protein Rs2_43763 [Raphanus sativus]
MSLCLLEKLLFRSKHPMSRLVRGFSFGADSGFGGCGGSHASSSRKKREIVLGLPASNAVPPSRGRSRAGAVGSAKRKRCTRSEEGEVSARLSQHRSKIADWRLHALSKELDSSRETLKRTEAALQSIESTHAAQTSTLEARISDLERDLGKTVSSLLKARRRRRASPRKFERLKRRIQRFEETGTCTAVELAGPSSSGTLVPGSEIPEVQDARVAADKGGEESARAMAKLFCFG